MIIAEIKSFAFLLLTVALFSAYAAEHLVISNGKSKAYPTAAKALAKAKSGDTVILADGFYEGGLKMTVPNVVLKGSKNTFICAGRKVTDWKPAPEAGKNAWKTQWKKVPANVVCNGRLLLELHAANGNGALNYKEIMKYGVASTGRALLGGIFAYDRKSMSLIVSLSDVDDINKCAIYVADRGKDALTIAADNCTVSDLTLVGGEAGIAFRNCKNSTVHNILAVANNNGILFTDNCSDCTAHHCDVILNPDSFSCNAQLGPSSAVWDVWLAHKRVGSWDKTGIALFWAGKGNRIYSNTVYNHWNGIHCGTNPKTWNKGLKEYYFNNIVPQKGRVNQYTQVYNNRVDLCMDDALEPAGDVQDQQWYSNVVTRAHCGIRIKTIDIGPLYIYDNDVSGCLDGIRFFKNLTEPAQVYVIHNRLKHDFAHTFASVETIPLKGVLGNKVPGGVRGGHMHNNLYITREYTAAFPPKGTALFTASNNAYTCSRPSELPAELEKNSRFDLKVKENAETVKEVQAKELSQIELPIAMRGKYAGLLNISSEKTPKTFISGRYENAAKILDMRVREWNFKTLESHSFVMAPEQSYIIENPQKLEKAKILLRAYLGPKMKLADFKIVFLNGKQIISEKKMKFLAVQELEIPLSGHAELTMKIISKNRKASWSIECLSQKIACKLVLDKQLDIVSYNNIAEITVDIAPAKGCKEIAVKAAGVANAGFSWISPDGKKTPFTGAKINTDKAWKLVSENSRRLQLAPATSDYPVISTPIIENIAPKITLRPPTDGFKY